MITEAVIPVHCRVVKHGDQFRMIPAGFHWHDQDPPFCIHGVKLRWSCDYCDDIGSEATDKADQPSVSS